MAPAETIAQNLKGFIRQKAKKDDETQYSSNPEESLRNYGLEVVSKPQIRFKRTRARRRPIEKVSVYGYVSIYRRPATQPLGLRWGFETTSMDLPGGNACIKF
jgi:hypothetical protein